MRHLIAYLFIAIFSLQIIPIKEIGEILYKGQITEEEFHNYGHETDEAGKKLKKDNLPLLTTASQNYTRIMCMGELVRLAILHTEKLPQAFVADIVTPPPNSGGVTFLSI